MNISLIKIKLLIRLKLVYKFLLWDVLLHQQLMIHILMLYLLNLPDHHEKIHKSKDKSLRQIKFIPEQWILIWKTLLIQVFDYQWVIWEIQNNINQEIIILINLINIYKIFIMLVKVICKRFSVHYSKKYQKFTWLLVSQHLIKWIRTF